MESDPAHLRAPIWAEADRRAFVGATAHRHQRRNPKQLLTLERSYFDFFFSLRPRSRTRRMVPLMARSCSLPTAASRSSSSTGKRTLINWLAAPRRLLDDASKYCEGDRPCEVYLLDIPSV